MRLRVKREVWCFFMPRSPRYCEAGQRCLQPLIQYREGNSRERRRSQDTGLIHELTGSTGSSRREIIVCVGFGAGNMHVFSWMIYYYRLHGGCKRKT